LGGRQGSNPSNAPAVAKTAARKKKDMTSSAKKAEAKASKAKTKKGPK